MGHNRKVMTRGFKVFSWYLRITMGMVILALAPLVLMYVAVSSLLGAIKSGLRRGLYGDAVEIKAGKIGKEAPLRRLLGPDAAQFFVRGHVFVSNVLFFTLFAVAALKIASPDIPAVTAFKAAGLVSLAPACLMLVISLACRRVTGFIRHCGSFFLRHFSQPSFHGTEGEYDGVEVSVPDLILRDRVNSPASMTLLSDLDMQLTFGVPTALVFVCCYKYDLYSGQKPEAPCVAQSTGCTWEGPTRRRMRGF